MLYKIQGLQLKCHKESALRYFFKVMDVFLPGNMLVR